MYADFHMHSSFSSDSDAPMEDMVRSAITHHLDKICFTEHMDFDFPPGEFDFITDVASYEKKLMEVREKYKEQIDIRFGIEIGLQTHLKDKLQDFTTSYPFDFIIGSNHLALGQDPYEQKVFQEYGEERTYLSYFENFLENIKIHKCFQVCGHLDYILRYGPNRNTTFSYRKYGDLLDEFLKVIIYNGIGLECNTSGFKYGLGHPHPTEEILIRYRELGGEILTMGSDAHAPLHVGYEFPRAAALLKDCGFTYYTVFKDKKPEFLLL